jgi:hypothetical protein
MPYLILRDPCISRHGLTKIGTPVSLDTTTFAARSGKILHQQSATNMIAD